MSGPSFSVVIPAHNEASVIARCLNALQAEAPEGAMEIIVVCNGCTDDTARIARELVPSATVVEVAQGSKPLALNMGNELAKACPRFFVDADIEVGFRSLEAVAQELRGGTVHVAAPAMQVASQRSMSAVRDYYKVWLSQPYVTDGMVGSGVFGLSEQGLERVGEFPPIIADDEYVRTRFGAEERCRLDRDRDGRPVLFVMHPPRNLKSLLKIESRQRAGMAELHRLYPSPQTETRMTSSGSLLDGLGQDYGARQLFWYLGIKLAGRALYQLSKLRGRQKLWLRDESSRAG